MSDLRPSLPLDLSELRVPHGEVYLDNNATTQPLPEVRAAMMDVLGEEFGNPSSAHSAGDRSRLAVQDARHSLAGFLGAVDEQIIFTSSGTEANNLVLLQALNLWRRGSISQVVTSTVEHSSILKAVDFLEAEGLPVVRLPVDSDGLLALPQLSEAVSETDSFVSIQWVNNETGVIQNIEEIARLCRGVSAPIHTDAAQAFGKIEIDLPSLPVDYLTVTAHKVHGPQGIGALYARNPKDIHPIGFGGDQESGIRPGTENVAGIVGFGAAVKARRSQVDSVVGHTTELRDRLEWQLQDRLADLGVNGSRENRVGNVTNIRFEGIDGQALIVRLDQVGIRCSQSSACTNARPEPSYVLRAMGLSETEAYSSVRLSFSELNTVGEVDYAVAQIVELCEQQRQFFGHRMAVG